MAEIDPGYPRQGTIEADVADLKNLIIVGYIVLLVMVATLVTMVFDMYAESNRMKEAKFQELIDKIDSVVGEVPKSYDIRLKGTD